MKDELPDEQTVEASNAAAPTGGVTPPCDDPSQETSRTGDEQTQTEPDDGQENVPSKEPSAETETGKAKNQLKQTADRSPASILSAITGNNNWLSNILVHADAAKKLAQFVIDNPLPPSKRSYQSVNGSDIAGHVGILLTQRILLLSCHDEDVADNVGKSIAHESGAASKLLITIETNCEGTYTVKDLIEELACRKEDDGRDGRPGSESVPPTICVWAAHDIGEGDVSNAILDSLLTSNAKIEQYQIQLSRHGLCLVCLVSPQKLQDYKRKRSNLQGNLQNWEIDFLRPLLEEYGLSGVDELAEAVVEQRRQGKWDADDARFYVEIGKHLSTGKLPEVVAGKSKEEVQVNLDLEQLFDWENPLDKTLLYCATYYSDLSPQDFSQLVQIFLDDDAEEDKSEESGGAERSQNGGTAAAPPAPPSLTQRLKREFDIIRRRCRLAARTDKNNRRVIDFQDDGLRSRLSQYIRDDHYFFYEAKFEVARRRGLLFSPKKKIADRARQLLVEMAMQYAPNEVAGWLYEIVYEFEQTAQAADLLRDRSQLFQLLPDIRVRAARHYVCHGLSLVLNKFDKEPDLQEAARLFWLKLLQTQRRWFLDLLRQMGNSAPAETLGWLKQILDQGSEGIRERAQEYLLGYLLRRDSLVYPTLKELMQWPTDGQAGRAMQMLLIVYCVETNRRLPQQDYGQWPSPHPLLGFRDRAEARECLELLIGWLFNAAFEVDVDNGLSIVADIVAGWYFILTPPSQPAPAEIDDAREGEEELDSRAVRHLLLERLAQHCSRPQRRVLLEKWEEFRNNLLENVSWVEEYTDLLAGDSLDAKLLKDAATARRNLLDTRALLGQLRKDFMCCAAEVAQG